MTSVKDVLVDSPPEDGVGRGRFRFTDDYSVFDWGKMPDEIPGKGSSLCTMGAATFELLEDADVPTHYRGVVDDGEAVPLSDVTEPPREMAVDIARVPDLPADGRTYDYDAYYEAAGDCYLIPLEIVFRNTVPVGSSLRSRATPEDVGLELDDWPERDVDLPSPVVEFSTKLEDGDRYLDRTEAERIAGDVALYALESVAREVNRVVTDRAAEIGLDHQDGKIECIAVDGEVRVADVAGTLDENRFSYDGTQISKEFLRRYYRDEQPEWVDAVADAKAEARERGLDGWKQLCDRDPGPLPDDVKDAAADLYAAAADAYAGRDLFDAPPLPEAVENAREAGNFTN